MSDFDAFLARARAEAEANMADLCTVESVVEGAFNDANGQRDPDVRTLLHSGRCRIQVRQRNPDTPTSGEHRYVVNSVEIQMPVATPNVPADAELTITASKFDPQNVGRVFTVIAGLRKSQATVYRIHVSEVAG